MKGLFALSALTAIVQSVYAFDSFHGLIKGTELDKFLVLTDLTGVGNALSFFEEHSHNPTIRRLQLWALSPDEDTHFTIQTKAGKYLKCDTEVGSICSTGDEPQSFCLTSGG
ncbi:uncharacterized protein N7484_003813 [Penicillium longicatenatum]|uniref:uncharacterized protein n=1 Tax=Penicillium longicatenatum TaxID=1561947 RepID=UPI002547CC53|nr:uncharacterized protein N7484_003813 [Penicillium longicatenatum]KAJ5650090.1 hypothetical protein N7484_003813 [Penicillium longicatenatum]